MKYLTRKLDLKWGEEPFALSNQAAQPVRRYDFCNDIQRLEQVVARGSAKAGSAILLTNDSSYWKPVRQANIVDAAFRVHEGRKITGNLTWSERASQKTTAGKEAQIVINGSYDLGWQDYSNFGAGSYRQFRYLVVPVTD